MTAKCAVIKLICAVIKLILCSIKSQATGPEKNIYIYNNCQPEMVGNSWHNTGGIFVGLRGEEVINAVGNSYHDTGDSGRVCVWPELCCKGDKCSEGLRD